jgi:glutamate transport system substrate-binding protein
MRTKRFAVMAAAAAIAMSLAACADDGGDGDGDGTGDPSPATGFEAGTTMARINEAQSLRVGTKFDQPGFGQVGLSEDPEGFDVEIAKIIAGELGVPEENIEWTEAQSAVREDLIESGDVDIVVATYTINDERKERIDFAGPYYIAGQHIMVRADDDSITGPESFEAGDKTVCTVTGSTPAENIQQYLASVDEQLVLFGGYQECVDALSAGDVDAVTTDNVILLGFIATNEGQFKLAGQAFTEEPYGIGVAKGDDAFRDFINDVLEEIVADGRYNEAWQATAGQFDPNLPTPPTVDRY